MSKEQNIKLSLELAELIDRAERESVRIVAKDDDELYALSCTYEKIGDLTIQLYRINKSEEAIQAYKNAIRNMKLIKREDVQHKIRLSQLYDKMANAYFKKGTPEMLSGACDAYLGGAIYKEELYEATHDKQYLSALAAVYEKIGGIHYIFGDMPHLKQAATCYDRAIRFKKDYYGDLSDEKLLSSLAAMCYKLGSIHERIGGYTHLHEAMDAYSQALDYNRMLSEKDPTPVARKSLATSYTNIGNVYMRLHDEDTIKEAIKAYEEAIALKQTLADASVDHLLSQATLYRRLCEAYLESTYKNRNEKALEASQASLAVYEDLATMRGTNDAKESLAHAYGLVGHVYSLMGLSARDAAREAYERAVELLEGLSSQPSVRYKTALSHMYNKLGNAYYALDNNEMYQKSVDAYQKSIALNGTLHRKKAITLEDESITYANAANAYRHLGDDASQEEAVNHYQRAINLLETWRDAGHDEAGEEIAGLYNELGHVYFQKPASINLALDAYQHALDINQKLCERTNTALYREHLATSYTNIGNVYKEKGADFFREMIDHYVSASLLSAREVDIYTALRHYHEGVKKNFFLLDEINQKKAAALNLSEPLDDLLAICDYTRLRSYKKGTYYFKKGFISTKLPELVLIPYRALAQVTATSHELILTFTNHAAISLPYDKSMTDLATILEEVTK